MFKLSRLIPYLLKLLKFLEKKKGLIYPLILMKVVNYLISFIFKAEKIGFSSIIKIIYYFLSISNILLALIVLGVFSDPNYLELFSPSFLGKAIGWLWGGLHLMIPVIILNVLNDYFEYIIEFFRLACKRFIDWVLEGSNSNIPEISKDINKSNNNREPVDVYNPFYAKRYVDSEDYYGSYNGIPDIDIEPHKFGWKDFVLFGVLAVGITYYLYPDMYNNLYFAIKGKIFPGSGGSGGGGLPGFNAPPVSDKDVPYKVYKGKNFSVTTVPVTSEQVLRSNMEEIAFSGLTSAEKNASLLHLYNDVLKSGDVINKSNQIADLAVELNNTISKNPTMKPFTMDLNGLRHTTVPTTQLIIASNLSSPEGSVAGYLTPVENINRGPSYNSPSMPGDFLKPLPQSNISTGHITPTQSNLDNLRDSLLGSHITPTQSNLSTGYITPKGVSVPPVLGIDTNVGDVSSSSSSSSTTPTSSLSPQPSPAPLPVRSPGYPREPHDLSWISSQNRLRGFYSPTKPEIGVDIVNLMDKLNNIK